MHMPKDSGPSASLQASRKAAEALCRSEDRNASGYRLFAWYMNVERSLVHSSRNVGWMFSR